MISSLFYDIFESKIYKNISVFLYYFTLEKNYKFKLIRIFFKLKVNFKTEK